MYRPIGLGRAVQRPVVPGRSASLRVRRWNACSEQLLAMGKTAPFSPKTSSSFDVQLGAPCQNERGTGSLESCPSGDTTRIHVGPGVPDRKSTRLNSSHRCISYAV